MGNVLPSVELHHPLAFARGRWPVLTSSPSIQRYTGDMGQLHAPGPRQRVVPRVSAARARGDGERALRRRRGLETPVALSAVRMVCVVGAHLVTAKKSCSFLLQFVLRI